MLPTIDPSPGGISRALHEHGASLAFTYQGEALEKRVRNLADSIGSSLIMSADVRDDAELDQVFATIQEEWGGLDFLVHGIAFADKSDLVSGITATSRANFLTCLEISCFSLN